MLIVVYLMHVRIRLDLVLMSDLSVALLLTCYRFRCKPCKVSSEERGSKWK